MSKITIPVGQWTQTDYSVAVGVETPCLQARVDRIMRETISIERRQAKLDAMAARYGVKRAFIRSMERR